VVDFFNAIPCLQYLELFWYASAASIMDDLLHELSSSLPILEGGTPGFLPQLQSLVFYSNTCEESLVWQYIADIYTCPQRKLLSMEVNIREYEVRIEDDTRTRISQLIDQGANISILKCGRDYTKDLLSTLST